MRGAQLREANFSKDHPGWTNESGGQPGDADLRGANFTEADLSHADLRKACLLGANFTHANLSEADLRGANLTGIGMSGVPTVFNKTFGKANFKGANLSKADLRGVDLEGVDSSEAILDGAFFD